MRADAAPIYATKQAISLPRAALSMGMVRHALKRSEKDNHSEALVSALAAVSSAAGGGEPTSPASSRAASALEIVSYTLFAWFEQSAYLKAFACAVDSFSF